VSSHDRHKLEERICELEQRKESFIQLIMDVRKKLHRDERRHQQDSTDRR